MGISQAKVPAIVSTGIVCFALGVGLGVLGMRLLGNQPNPTASAGGAASAAIAESPDGPTPGGQPGSPGGGAPGAGRTGGRRGPSPKWQLASLVTKLDLLSRQTLAVRLSDQQKKTVREQLQGLDTMQELSAEEAKKRLDVMLETVKDQKGTLEAAGYRWPGQSRFRRPADTPNPFLEEENAKALTSLRQQLDKPAAK